MKKIAIFGKPANGKSTLSKNLASATGIKPYAVDSLLYKPSGEEVDREYYEQRHQQIIAGEQWIVEGFAPMNSLTSFYQRLEAADTLIYIDLPYPVTYWLVTKRMLMGLFRTPEGWPEGSSVLKGTIQSYKVLKLCPRFWNAALLQKIEAKATNKTLHVIRSVAQLNSFVERHVV